MQTTAEVDFNQKIYDKYYRLIYSTCYRQLNDKGMIEDAVQATFLLFLKEKFLGDRLSYTRKRGSPNIN